ncbi:MAG: hypothetical protein JWO83_881 [Caulobacteraceae bacterium]|nr:hypothetical protein [Caulobacteraceae bacterium]
MAEVRASGVARVAMGAVAWGAMVLAAGGAARAAEASSQTDAASVNLGPVLGEVVVTAQKRSENLQKTPIAITAVTGDRIEQGNLAQPVQLQFQVPSMTFGNDNGYSYLTLRGVGNDTTTTAAESSVATYLDGVYTGDLISESIPTYDLQRIEVLRGPQGTLYGRNTTGGVINYITKSPSFDPGANAAISYGNYNAVQADAGVTGPIVPDMVAGRLSLHWGQHDGYRENIATNKRIYSDVNYSGRASLLFRPNNNLTITLRGDLSHDRATDAFGLIHSTALDGLTTPETPLGIFSLPAAQLGAIGGILSPADLAKLNGGSIATYYGLLQPGPAPPDPLKTLQISNSQSAVMAPTSDGGSVTIDWNLGPATVKSITAYRYNHLRFLDDTGGIGSPSVYFLPFDQIDKQFTQEVDISGKAFNNRLDWLAGAFYFHDDGSTATTVWLPSFGDFINASFNLANPPGSPYAFNLNPSSLINFTNFVAPNILSTVVTNGPNFVGGAPLTAFSSIPNTAFLGFNTTQESQSVAGFAQATYHITEALRFTGGFRFTADRKTAVRSLHSNLIYALTGGNPGASLCDHITSSRSWTAPTGTVGVDYDAAPHVLTYAKASWGYKAGGINPGECTHIFDPEYLTDYEGGVKAIFADGQILTNAAMYYYDYSNIQFTTYINNASAILNAGTAQIFGVELEYVVQPRAVPGLELDGSASFEDSHYGVGCFADPANLNNAGSANPLMACPTLAPGNGRPIGPSASIKGNELIRAPKWKTNVGLQYTAHLESGGSLLGRFEAAYTDTIYNDIFNGKAPDLATATQPSYWILNARLVWTSPDRRYSAELFGDNITNTYYTTNRVGFNTPATVENVGGQFAPPATYGVRVTVKLGSAAR